jgi:hypothetical protein
MFITLQRDTSEALGYARVALGVFLWDYGGRWRIALAGCAFSIAALTRETTAIFPAIYGLSLLFAGPSDDSRPAGPRGRLVPAIAVMALAVGPLLIYKAFLFAWLGTGGDPGLLLERIPFLGLLVNPRSSGWIEGVRTVVIPDLCRRRRPHHLAPAPSRRALAAAGERPPVCGASAPLVLRRHFGVGTSDVRGRAGGCPLFAFGRRGAQDPCMVLGEQRTVALPRSVLGPASRLPLPGGGGAQIARSNLKMVGCGRPRLT